MKKRKILLWSMIGALGMAGCQNGGTHRVSTLSKQEAAGNDTVSITLGDGGRMKELVMRKDSGACQQLITTFYPNGLVKTKGCQGTYSDGHISTGMFVGTWSYFDSAGHLEETIFYHNDVAVKAFIEKKKYYPNGRLKSVERFNNYDLYEAEIDSIGNWQFYNDNGALVNTIHYKKESALQ